MEVVLLQRCFTVVELMYWIQEPLYCEHFGTLILVLITEVSSIQRSLNSVQ